MRLLVVFASAEEIFLPWNYLDWLRGLIYRLLRSNNEGFAQWLHQEGTIADNKRYKPFTFSLLYPQNKKATKKGLLIKGEIKWFISSPIPLICQILSKEFLHSPLHLGPHKLEILKVFSLKYPPLSSPSHFTTLSPISISTAIKEGEKLRKIYLFPSDELFPQLLKENLLNKASAMWLPKGDIEIELKPPFRSRLFKIKGIDVRGWDMELALRGDEHLIKLAYDIGLGEHNACGFGMLHLKSKEPGGENLANNPLPL